MAPWKAPPAAGGLIGAIATASCRHPLVPSSNQRRQAATAAAVSLLSPLTWLHAFCPLVPAVPGLAAFRQHVAAAQLAQEAHAQL